MKLTMDMNMNKQIKKSVQYKLLPLPTASSFYVLHLQYGTPGNKDNGDYHSSSIVVPQKVALALLKKGTKNSCSFRPKSLQGYVIPDDYIVPEFSDAWSFGTEVSFRQLIDATVEGVAEERFSDYDVKAKEEMAAVLAKKLQGEILEDWGSDETAH